PIYRLPPGGGRVTPQSEPRFFHGPPLNNAQVSADIGGRQVFVTTFDRDRRVGVVYRLIDGQMRVLAGGAPETGESPALVQPEGVAVNRAGQVFVADRERGVVVRLDAEGRVLDESFARVVRPRAIAIDEADHLWIGADSGAEAPWQPGPGQIWRVSPEGQARLVLEGPVAQGLAPGPGGVMFVAARQGAYIFALTPEGEQIILARFTHGDAPRALTIAPAPPPPPPPSRRPRRRRARPAWPAISSSQSSAAACSDSTRSSESAGRSQISRRVVADFRAAPRTNLLDAPDPM